MKEGVSFVAHYDDAVKLSEQLSVCSALNIDFNFELFVLYSEKTEELVKITKEFSHRFIIHLMPVDLQVPGLAFKNVLNRIRYSYIFFTNTIRLFNYELCNNAIDKIVSSKSSALRILHLDGANGLMKRSKSSMHLNDVVKYELLENKKLRDFVLPYFLSSSGDNGQHNSSYLLTKSAFRTLGSLVGREALIPSQVDNDAFTTGADRSAPLPVQDVIKVVYPGLSDLPQKMQKDIAQAKEASTARKWREAAQRWEAVYNACTDCIPPEVIAKLGQSYRYVGYNDRAETLLHDAVLEFPGYMAVAVEYAYIAAARKDWSEAILRWKALLNNFGDKNSGYIFSNLANAYSKIQDFDSAEGIAKQGLEKYPNYIPLHTVYAECAMSKQEWTAAMARWKVILNKQGPKASGNIYRRMSVALRCCRSFDAAEEYTRQACANYPDDIALAGEYAEIAMARQDWKEAVQRWQAVINLFGKSAGVGAYVRMSVAFRNNMELPAAEKIIRQALVVFPNNVELLRIKAEISMAQRDWHQAVQAWAEVFQTLDESKKKWHVERFLQIKVADWTVGDWCHVAENIRKGFSIKVGCKQNFIVYLSEILKVALFLEDAEKLLEYGCNQYPEDDALLIKHAELAMETRQWSYAIERWNSLLDKKDGGAAPLQAYEKLCLSYYMNNNDQKSREILQKGSVHYKKLANLHEKYKKFDSFLNSFSTVAAEKSKVSFKILCLEPDSKLVDRVRCGTYITSSEITSLIAKKIGDKFGHVDTRWAGRFIRGVSRKISLRYGKLNEKMPILPSGTIADALFYIIYTELSSLIPLRHLARQIALETKDRPVFIEIKSLTMSYVNFWGSCGLEPLYLYVELLRCGVNVFLCYQENNIALKVKKGFDLNLQIRPSQRLIRRKSLQCSKTLENQSHSAVVPDGIRGIDNVLNMLGDIHVLTSTGIAMTRPYNKCNEIKPIEFTDSLYASVQPLDNVVINFVRSSYFSMNTKEDSGDQHLVVLSDLFNVNLFYWLSTVLGDLMYGLALESAKFVKKFDIKQLHICDHFFMDSAILTHAVKSNRGKITLWPHSTNPVFHYFRRKDEVDEIHCMMKNGIDLWNKYIPGCPVVQHADMMLDAPLSPNVKPGRHVVDVRKLSVVVIGSVFTMGRLPRLRINDQLASYRDLFFSLKQLGEGVDIYYKGKGSLADELSFLRDNDGDLLDWTIAMNHPLDLDYENMVYVSVSFGSSALLEGISRGIPAFVVRNFSVEDYTLLDPDYIPTGTTKEIVSRIGKCVDYNYRIKLINRQIRYFCKQTGVPCGQALKMNNRSIFSIVKSAIFSN